MKKKYQEFECKETGLRGLKDNSGKIIIEPTYISFYGYYGDRFIAVDSDKNIVFINYNSRVLQNLSKDYTIQDFKNGLAKVKYNLKYGLINSKGCWIAPPMYENIKIFSKEIIAICHSKQWAIINAKGEFLIEFGITQINELNLSVYLATEKGGIMINKNGKNLQNFEFAEIKVNSENTKSPYLVRKEGTWMHADKDFNILNL